MTTKALEKEGEIKENRLDYLYPNRKKNNDGENSNDNKDASGSTSASADGDFDLDGAWGDDDEDDDNVKANKKRQEEKEKLAEEVARASGKSKSDHMIKQIRVEGIDDGVIGQQWVENTLAGLGHWPPKSDLSVLESELDDLEGNPAVRRNLCMTMGRIHSQHLNSNPELRK